MLKKVLNEILNDGIEYLVAILNDNKSFPARSFYGESFTWALLENEKKDNQEIVDILTQNYKEKDFNDPEFHFEFNNYAFTFINSNKKDNLLNPIRFKGTPCTNWTLLRNLTKIKLGINVLSSINESKKTVKQFQKSSGLILDEKNVRSFQYHCFSVSLIYELFQLTGDSFFYDRFKLGVKFILPFILPNGDALYLGRGQEQIFGQASLIYILSIYYKCQKDIDTLYLLKVAIDFLNKNKREDGSLPCVLNEFEKGFPETINVLDTNYLGWYPYNNYFDYLPFALFQLSKTKDILSNIDIKDELGEFKPLGYHDRDYIKIVKKDYLAVLARPGGGRSTNGMPLPYIFYKNKAITTCYGGEDFQSSIYDNESVPLPYCSLLKKNIDYRGITFFIGETLFVISPLGIFIRKFHFDERKISIKDYIFSPFKFKNTFLSRYPLENSYFSLKSKKRLKSGKGKYCAQTKLLSFYTYGNNQLIYELKNESISNNSNI